MDLGVRDEVLNTSCGAESHVFDDFSPLDGLKVSGLVGSIAGDEVGVGDGYQRVVVGV